MAKSKLFLIDGHALCYRSFYAIRELTTSKGQPTNAIFGFVKVMKKLITEYQPQYMAVCFDAPGKTKRQEKFAEYKIQRPSMPEELRSQIPVIKEVLEAYNISIYEKSGFEADDIIATLSKKAVKQDLEVVIVSDDKDMYQLAGSHVKYFNSKSGKILNIKEVQEKLGFAPKCIVDYIGLAGDTSDNIPGVDGIGAVGAKELINTFGNLDSILKAIGKIKKPKGKEKLLIDQKKKALFSKELAILDDKVPIKAEIRSLKVREPDGKKLFTMFRDLEFSGFAQEHSSEDTAQSIKVKEVSSVDDIKALVSKIRKAGQFAFIIENDLESGLFHSAIVYIAGGEKHISRIKSGHISELRPVFENKAIRKITYNIKDMFKALSAYNIDVCGNVFDVMLAGYLLGGTQASFEIDNLSWNYLKRSLPDDHKTAAVVSAVEQLHPLLNKEIKKKFLLELFENIEIPLARVLSKIETTGVSLDVALLKRMSKQTARQIDELSSKLIKMAGEEFNINSPKQLSRILFEKLELPVIKKTKTGFSTNEAVLTILADSHEFPALILDYRQLTKLKSTYIDALPKMIDPDTGKLHAQFNQAGTETGRLSSSNPNLQNIPIRTELGRQIRKAIIPSKKDWILISADYSQIELRILAHLSGDQGLINSFKNGEDIHTHTASLIFDVKEKDVTSDMRNSAKRVNFGIIYGISAFGLANDLKVTQSEAQEFIDRYFLRYPSVRSFMDNEIKKCEKNGYVLTLLNRRRYIPEIKSSNGAMKQFAQRQAINTPVQGSAADLIKLAMINIQNEIEHHKLSTKMISTVHDELVFEGPPSEKNEMAKMVRTQMEHVTELKVPVKVSIKAGKNWLDMEDVS